MQENNSVLVYVSNQMTQTNSGKNYVLDCPSHESTGGDEENNQYVAHTYKDMKNEDTFSIRDWRTSSRPPGCMCGTDNNRSLVAMARRVVEHGIMFPESRQLLGYDTLMANGLRTP